MLDKGKNDYRYDLSTKTINKEILEVDGFLKEEEAQILLYRFLRSNITFTTEMFLGVKLFPFQAMIIKSMMLGDFSMFILSRGSSKTYSAAVYVLLSLMLKQGIKMGVISSGFRQCLSVNSLLLTSCGLSYSQDIKRGDLVQARYGLQRVLNKWDNEEAESIKIETKRGYKLEGKLGHSMLVYDDLKHENVYKKIDDIKCGDYVPLSKGQLRFGNGKILDGFEYKPLKLGEIKPINVKGSDLELYYYIGMIIAKGSINKKRVDLTSGDIECLERIKRYLDKVAPESSDLLAEKTGREGTFNLTFCSAEFNEILEYIGYDTDSWLSCTKEIPQKLMSVNKARTGMLLRGMFDGDGEIHCYKNTHCAGEIKYTTTSPILAQQVHLLLLNFGIFSNLQQNAGYKKVTKTGVQINVKESWNIRITGKKNIRLYNEHIGFDIKRKKKKIKDLIRGWDSRDLIREDSSSIPNFGAYLRDNLSATELRKNGITSSKKPYPDNVSFDKVRRIGKKEDTPFHVQFKCSEVVKDNFFYDKVISLKESKCKTIDIEVENEHCYVGNGFINHNSKMILQKAEDILKKPSAKLVDGIFKLTKGTDQWTLTCGDSQAIALPLADGSRLRGFRFSVVLLDEFLNMPKSIFTEVILPFLGVVENPTDRADLKFIEDKLIAKGQMTEKERHQWVDNKLILLSSPSYTFEYMYELYCNYRDAILGVKSKQLSEEDFVDDDERDPYRIVIQLSYDCAPPTLYDKKQLKAHKQTMSEAVFAKEYGGQFVSESDSYFKLSKMAACTISDGELPNTEIIGNPDDEYIVCVDPSWSEDSSSDDFAMNVLKLDTDNKKACLVHAYGLAGTPLKSHIKYFHYLITNFNIKAVVLDYAGGVSFVSACNESKLFKDAKIKLGLIDGIEGGFDKPELYQKDLVDYKKAAPSQYKYCYLRKPTSQWIRLANELLQANIDHKRIQFASGVQGDAFNKQRNSAKVPIADLKWSNDVKEPSRPAAMIDFIDNQRTMIELTKAQCANIEVVTNPQGSQTFRLPPHMSRQSGANKPRRDNYSALVLGNWMAKIHFDSLGAEEVVISSETFTPFAI